MGDAADSTSTVEVITPKLFSEDPSILFSHGNYNNFGLDSPIERGNTLARVTIYASVALAAYCRQPKILLYGLLALAAIAFVFRGSHLPMNTYNGQPVRLTPTRIVHDRTKGSSPRQVEREFKNNLLTNVRERQIYLGGTTGAQTSTEFMLGGTRPQSNNRDPALRDNEFFANVGMTFESVVPSKDWV